MVADRVCLGAIAGPHGVRGLVRVRSFTQVPEDIAAYGPLSDESGHTEFRLALTGRAKGALLARIEGVTDRDRARALAGTRLYVARAALPEVEEDETFYHADLIGLDAQDRDGRPLGRVKAVHNFGAGDILELESDGGGGGLVPFTRAAVPVVDLAAGRVVIDPPPEADDRTAAEDKGT